MESFNKRAISEVIEILNHTDKDIVERIPEQFMKFLLENTDKDYISNINFYNNNWEDTIEDDTKALLALIYRDYIVSEEERLELLKEEKAEKERIEQEKKEKYNPDNLFKKRDDNEKQEVKNIQLVEIKKNSWYKRLFEKIISFFGKKNNK